MNWNIYSHFGIKKMKKILIKCLFFQAPPSEMKSRVRFTVIIKIINITYCSHLLPIGKKRFSLWKSINNIHKHLYFQIIRKLPVEFTPLMRYTHRIFFFSMCSSMFIMFTNSNCNNFKYLSQHHSCSGTRDSPIIILGNKYE